MNRQTHNKPCQILTAYIPCEIVDKMNKHAEKHDMNKSQIIKIAVLKYLENSIL